MNILIDIGHPAHVHYFKNFINIMQKKGNIFLIISRNKEIEHYLLNKYHIPFVNRGKGKKGLVGKALYLFKAIHIIFKNAVKFKPDIIMSFGSPYGAIVSKLIGKPHICFNDTEHARLSHLLTDPFTKTILTPSCYTKDLGSKHIRFKSYMELCYLHNNFFTPDPEIFNYLGIDHGEKYVILRFISWNASHDLGHKGLSFEMKLNLVNLISEHAKVFISSENNLPKDLNKYKINIPPEKIHDALSFAALFVGEGATMASECAMVNTPAIYINSLTAGTLEEQEQYGLIYGFRNSRGVLEKTKELLTAPDIDKKHALQNKKMLKDKIDMTAFMVWFVENYPDSIKIMKQTPDYQLQFK